MHSDSPVSRSSVRCSSDKILILTGKRSPEETVVFSRPPVSFHYSLEEGGKIETTVIESQVQRTGVSGRCVTDDA